MLLFGKSAVEEEFSAMPVVRTARTGPGARGPPGAPARW